MKVNFAKLCEHAFLSSSGAPSLINIFSEIKTASLPVQREVSLVFEFSPEDDEEYNISVDLINPANEVRRLAENTKIGPPKDGGQNLGFVFSAAIDLSSEGLHKIVIKIDGAEVSTLPFEVKVV